MTHHGMPYQSILRQFLSHFENNWAYFACVPVFSVFLIFLLLMAGCAPKSTSGGVAQGRLEPSSLYDPGDDVLLAPDERASQAKPGATSSEGVWSIALLTITGNDHQATAKALRTQIAANHPELKPLFLD